MPKPSKEQTFIGGGLDSARAFLTPAFPRSGVRLLRRTPGLRGRRDLQLRRRLLTEFCRAENIYRIRDASGNPLREVGDMLVASDPVHGTASSFGEERERRKHIGDYTLFFTGMYPESMHAGGAAADNFFQMVQAGKRATTSFRNSTSSSTPGGSIFRPPVRSFEACIYGLNMVRAELTAAKRFLRHPRRPGSARRRASCNLSGNAGYTMQARDVGTQGHRIGVALRHPARGLALQRIENPN